MDPGVLPGQKISYEWPYPDFPGNGLATFTLEELGRQCTLTLGFRGVESFPEHIPEFRREACEAGWNYFIRERLVAYMGK